MNMKSYVFAFVAPVIVAVAQFFLWDFVSPFVWFLFFPTVFFAARFGGIGSAMISALVSCVLVWYIFLPPQFSWHIKDFHNLYTVVVFLVMAYLFGESQEQLIKARNSLNAELDKSILQASEITQLYQENLALDEIKFSQLANSLPQIVWATTPDGKNIFFNEAWYEYTGMSKQEAMGDGWNKPFHPDDQPLAWNAWQDAVNNNAKYSLECRLRRFDGEYRWWLIRGIPAFNVNHEIDKWFGTCTDIHEIKNTLLSLSIEKTKLQTVFDNSPDGLAIISQDESLSVWNQKYMDYFSVEPDERDSYKYSQQKDRFELSTIHGELIAPINFPVSRALRGESVLAQELLLKNKLTGRQWYGSHSVMPIHDEGGKITGAVVSVRDITANIQDKIHLLNLVKEQETILNSGIVGIAKSKGNQFFWVNHRFADSFGYETHELLGHQINVLLPDIPRVGFSEVEISGVDLIQSALSKNAIQLRRKDGSFGWYLLTSSPLAFASDEIIWMSIDVSVDIKNKELLESYANRLEISMRETLHGLAKAVEMRDPYTAGHQQRVGDIAAEIAKKLKLTDAQIQNIRLIGIVHDIGKIGIPAEILAKPSRLTPLEYEVVKGHVNVGYEILKDIHFGIPVAQVVREHHERLDGSGYPQGLREGEISFEAKIIAVADVVEAMSTHRPYRTSLGMEAALSEIERGRGVKYDPAVVDACLELFRKDGYQIEQGEKV